jgi:signal transduction histidine kinase
MAHMRNRPLERWLAAPLFRWSVGIVATVIGGVIAFEAFDISVFKRIGLAHEYCYQREPRLIWLHVVSDVLIGTAYVSISATLGYLVYKASQGIPFNWVFLAFGLFIVSCGLTHFMEVWVIWEPVYWMSGYVKVITAAASVATAIALFPLVPKIFRLIAAARQSEQRRVEIEQLNQELERFNYSVAHDLRGPLRGISGFSQALREDCGAEMSPTATGYLDRIQGSVERMDVLISDLLKYATITRQELQLRRVELSELARATLQLLEGEIRQRRAEVIVTEPLPAVRGDPTLLQVVFQNLVGNAMKFVAPEVKPRVEISARHEPGNSVLVHVTDNGIGIPAEGRQRAFRMFERFERKHEGTGIGLPLVHRAIERMGGTLGITDGPAGRGTTFWFRLPAA